MPALAHLHPDRYALYEVAVQSVDWEIDFMIRIYRARHGRAPRRFREDFSGTAALATAWAKRDPRNQAIAVDRDPEPLAWARRHRLPFAGDAARRVQLVRGDVRVPRAPAVDVACALNFSWWVFHTRADLRRYLEAARRGLAEGGLLVMDAFGGDRSEVPLRERTRKRGGRTPSGERLPPFTYIWEHQSVNAIDRRLRAWIHFDIDGGPTLKRAFGYDWRMWSLPELRDAASDAGFSGFEVYAEGWDAAHGRYTGAMQRRRTLDNAEGWTVSCVLSR